MVYKFNLQKIILFSTKNNYLKLHASDPRPSHVRIDFSLSTDIVMNKHTSSIIFIITPLVSNMIHTIDSVAHLDTCLLITSRLHHKAGTFRMPGAETKQSCVGLGRRFFFPGLAGLWARKFGGEWGSAWKKKSQEKKKSQNPNLDFSIFYLIFYFFLLHCSNISPNLFANYSLGLSLVLRIVFT